MAQRWLQKQFRDFFVEVERQRAAIRAGRWAYQQDDQAPFDPKHAGQRGPNPVWEALANLLRRQAEKAGESGASGLQLYKRAQYAMIALADEIFIAGTGDWAGRKDWNTYPLELAFFNTRAAGETVFRNIEELLARRDPGERDLAEIYFNVLSLGFQGRYFVASRQKAPGARGNTKIDELRRRLYSCFGGERDASAGWVSAQPYKYIESRAMGAQIPNVLQSVMFLGIAIGFLMLAGIGFSSLLRGGVTNNVKDINTTLGDRVAARGQ